MTLTTRLHLVPRVMSGAIAYLNSFAPSLFFVMQNNEVGACDVYNQCVSGGAGRVKWGVNAV